MQKKLQRFMFLVFLVLVISEEHGNVAIVVQNFNQKFEIIYTPVVKFGKSDFYIELKIKDFK